jgi:hypothetical protein
VLSKGCQNSQSTTMLRNECTHTFLYVFGHYGEYMLSLLLILISKSWGGGVSPTLLSAGVLSAGVVCVCIPFMVYLLPCLLARLFFFWLQTHPVTISLVATLALGSRPRLRGLQGCGPRGRKPGSQGKSIASMRAKRKPVS